MELLIKVHTDLLADIIQERTIEKRYQTNKRIKLVSAYYILKSLTTSGVIRDYFQNIGELLRILDCTMPTFYKILRESQKAGYLRRSGRSIILTSYASFTETFDVVYTQFSNVKYTPGQNKFHHLLESAFMQIREREREKAFEQRMKSLPEVRDSLSTLINVDKNGNYASALKKLQIETFKHGHEKKNEIFLLNPFSSCNAKTLRKMFNFKSDQSIAYLKEKLTKAKLLSVKKTRVVSQKRLHVKHLFIEWDEKTQQTIWVQPDHLAHAVVLAV